MRMRRLPPALHEKIVSFYQDVWIQKQGACPGHRGFSHRVCTRASRRRPAGPVLAASMVVCLCLPLPLLAPDGRPRMVLRPGACSAPAGRSLMSASDCVACRPLMKSTVTANLLLCNSGRVRMQSGARTSSLRSCRRCCAARWPACCCWARCAVSPPLPSAPPADVPSCGHADGPIKGYTTMKCGTHHNHARQQRNRCSKAQAHIPVPVAAQRGAHASGAGWRAGRGRSGDGPAGLAGLMRRSMMPGHRSTRPACESRCAGCQEPRSRAAPRRGRVAPHLFSLQPADCRRAARRLPAEALQRMAAEMSPLTVFPGQDLSHQGEAADRIFVLAEGARARGPRPCRPPGCRRQAPESAPLCGPGNGKAGSRLWPLACPIVAETPRLQCSQAEHVSRDAQPGAHAPLSGCARGRAAPTRARGAPRRRGAAGARHVRVRAVERARGAGRGRRAAGPAAGGQPRAPRNLPARARLPPTQPNLPPLRAPTYLESFASSCRAPRVDAPHPPAVINRPWRGGRVSCSV